MTKEYDCTLLSVKAKLDPASTSRRRYLFAARVGTPRGRSGFASPRPNFAIKAAKASGCSFVVR
jgi:hypothetical protein